MCLVGDKTPKEYAQQESLLWECIFLGLAFHYSIGVTRVNFLPLDDSPFLPFTFHWLPNVWIIYAAIAKVLIQLRLGLETIGFMLDHLEPCTCTAHDLSDQLASFQILESVAIYSHFLDYLDQNLT
ncbi:hypothetical protein DSO57_1031165 [Entomophthora muscae]|uniref:Uncharacterized protein n=1 Tax=Entomophthora muscae TaxID=34485 RepID=A0ACC2RFF7_9FUNG|nr:hypothetical protein DSO57_1031165 [Entomophthora muscae]